jgi:2-oxoisovalerate dehydrogenase E1 component beta subunit
VAAIIAEKAWESLDAPLLRVASLNVPVPFSPTLEDAVLPDVQKIEQAARYLLEY